MNGQACPKERMDMLLLATDGGESAKSAMREALNLAKQCSSNLIVVAVVGTHRHFENAQAWHLEMERAEKTMRDRLEPLRRLASEEGVDCEVHLRRGEDPYLDIVDEAGKNRVGMVIMGTHGRKGISRVVQGSVTANVIGHAPCHVLVVPSGVEVGYRNILIATDGSKHSVAAAFEAIAIAKRCAGALVIVAVATSEPEVASANQHVTQIMELAEKEGVGREGLVVRGRPHEAIVEIAKQKRADLIVVGSHGRTGLMHLLMGSVTEQVICHAECAVLVVKV